MLRTIQAAAGEVRSGRVTPLDLLDECLKQIDRYEPHVKAWVFVDRERAQAEAEARTAELKQGRWRGPLHGIPLGVKDIYDVFDWPTAAGSKLWSNSVARQDCMAVARLRQAGAVFLGKTVTTQYASFDPPVTRNPWNAHRTPGGSSSGSAAATACGMCLGALSSQTGGSITRPAAYCGVPSFKPSYGRICLRGVVPLAESMDHCGAMAGSVRDLALLLQTLAQAHGGPGQDEVFALPDVVALLNRPLPRPRIARLRGMFQDLAEQPLLQLVDRACEKLAAQGAIIEEVALPAGFAEVLARHRIVMAVEAAQFHEPRLRSHPEDYLPKIRSLLEEGLACPAPEYARCKEHQRVLAREANEMLLGFDALLTPASTSPAPDAATTGDPAFNSPWSYTGLPTVSLPAGWTSDGLPLSIQLVGRRFEEAGLFQAAAWCEDTLAWERREPPI